MKVFALFLLLLILGKAGISQSIVFDRDHFNIVNQNGFMRLASELSMHHYYQQMDERLSDIKINIGSLILAQQLIYSSLTQVDQALKSAIAVKEISGLVAEIFEESRQMVAFASDHPHLLILSERISLQLRDRGVNLVSEVSSIVLSQRSDLLLNMEKRDHFLKKISLELKVIRALIFSMRKSMFWASKKSLLSQINPYRNFINIDKRLVESIISKYKTLSK